MTQAQHKTLVTHSFVQACRDRDLLVFRTDTGYVAQTEDGEHAGEWIESRKQGYIID